MLSRRMISKESSYVMRISSPLLLRICYNAEAEEAAGDGMGGGGKADDEDLDLDDDDFGDEW